MDVPEQVIRDFVDRLSNAKWLRSYFVNLLEEHEAKVARQPLFAQSDEPTINQKINIITTAYTRQEFHMKPFEEDFILGKETVTELSPKQLPVLENIWRKYKRTVPDLF
jgi:hypothetical protein